MQPSSPTDLIQAAASLLQPIYPLLLIAAGISFGLGMFNHILKAYHEALRERAYQDWLKTDEGQEKSKHGGNPLEVETFDAAETYNNLADEKPKRRLVGDDGELFHPIDEE